MPRDKSPEIRAAVGRMMTAARVQGRGSPEAVDARQGVAAVVLTGDIREALDAGLLADRHCRELADMLLAGGPR
ncbi:hypothetical protein [Geodermatophilus sp. SYSU D00700]